MNDKEKGIFGMDYKIPFEDLGEPYNYNTKNLEKLHSFFFPLHIEEATVTV